MNSRQKELFRHIVEEYVKTAQPVGSKLVVEKFNLDISPATVRNDMAELEHQGLIHSPHTSAGRMPTEYGYRYYVENFVDFKKKLANTEDTEKKSEDTENKKSQSSQKNSESSVIAGKDVKNVARKIAQKSGLAVFVGHGPQDIYYTGLSNLFSQPEFQDLDLIFNMSNVLDHLDEMIKEMYDDFSNDLEIRIGENNPFNNNCSSIIIKRDDELIGLIGPMRMDYQKNIDLIKLINEII